MTLSRSQRRKGQKMWLPIWSSKVLYHLFFSLMSYSSWPTVLRAQARVYLNPEPMVLHFATCSPWKEDRSESYQTLVYLMGTGKAGWRHIVTDFNTGESPIVSRDIWGRKRKFTDKISSKDRVPLTITLLSPPSPKFSPCPSHTRCQSPSHTLFLPTFLQSQGLLPYSPFSLSPSHPSPSTQSPTLAMEHLQAYRETPSVKERGKLDVTNSAWLWCIRKWRQQRREMTCPASRRLPLSSPSSATGKKPTCQCKRLKRHRFDPWVGKIAWKWHPTPVFLSRKFPGQRSLVGQLQSIGLQRVGQD